MYYIINVYICDVANLLMMKRLLYTLMFLLLALMGVRAQSDASEALNKVHNFYSLATAGDAEAQYRLSSCYHDGYGVEQSDSLAFYWARLSAQQEHPAGLYFLAYCYETGRGANANQSNASYLYQQAFEKALPLATRGDASAQFVVGKIYDYGNGGVKLSHETAVTWYRRAAEQGYAGAQFNLGNCYQLGEGVQQDKKQAVYWYRQAALQNDPDAQYTLGLCYASGEGVAKSARRAIEWFRLSARQGNRLAQQILLSINLAW